MSRTIYDNDVRFSVEEQVEEIARRRHHKLEQSKFGLWRLLTLENVKTGSSKEMDIAIDLKDGTSYEEAKQICSLLNEKIRSVSVIETN